MTDSEVNREAPRFWEKLNQFRRRAAKWIRTIWERAHPGPRARKGASRGAAAAVLALMGLVGTKLMTSMGWPVDLLIGLLVGCLALLVLAVVFRLARALLRVIPHFLGWIGAAALVGCTALLIDFGLPPLLVFSGLGFLLLEGLLGGAVAAATDARFRSSSPKWKSAVLAALLLCAGANVALAVWLIQAGSDDHLIEAALTDLPAGAEPALPDPSLPGPYSVQYLTYGSGTDRLRPEFGAEARLKTPSVDARPLVRGFKGWRKKLRGWYWGFGPETFPLNGRVWYPEGEGPFPLVLIVHGNHNMGEFSDPGYGWLGELLASRGFLFVSVDENFLNGSAIGGVPKENDARGWMLLEHLKVWREWNDTEGNPFHGKVDLERVGLIGHSRGGEAAAIAGCFNRLGHYPDDAAVRFDFGFGIRAIIAIAPSDGQYSPAGQPVPLEDVNYFTLQGGHDSDVSPFLGDRQYNRVRFSGGDWFKSSLYIYRANHGQFNTVWGNTDFSPPLSWLLNLKPLHSGEEQRKIGAVYMSGFLEATLRDQKEYRRLFRDRGYGSSWLPESTRLTRYEDASFRLLSDYEEDVDVTTTTAAGGAQEASGLVIWREQDMNLRRGTVRRNNAVYLGWDREAEGSVDGSQIPYYSIRLPEGFASQLGLSPESLLVFHLAEADEKPERPEEEEEEEEEEETEKGEAEKEEKEEPEKGEAEKKKPEPLDFSIELVSRDGSTFVRTLASLGGLQPKMVMRFTKAPALEEKFYGTKAEPVLQVYELPLAALAEAEGGFHPSDLSAIRLVFDRSPRGVIILDRVGFARR